MEYHFYLRKIKGGIHNLAIDVNVDNYTKEVLESDLPVLVDFWGPQCGPCLALMPVVDELEKTYHGVIKVTKLNPAAGNRMFCAKLRVMGLPTFLFYKNGAEVKRLCGEKITREDLLKAINEIKEWNKIY